MALHLTFQIDLHAFTRLAIVVGTIVSLWSTRRSLSSLHVVFIAVYLERTFQFDWDPACTWFLRWPVPFVLMSGKRFWLIKDISYNHAVNFQGALHRSSPSAKKFQRTLSWEYRLGTMTFIPECFIFQFTDIHVHYVFLGSKIRSVMIFCT